MIETRLSSPLEFKFAIGDAAGSFSGYGSTWAGEPDAFGDTVAPNAFTESLADHAANGTVPALLWAHRTDSPIGVWTSLKEDRRGLAVEGKLTLGTRLGAEARALMLDGALALSIGFRVPAGGVTLTASSRILKKIDLVEISCVSLPANINARVTSIKSAAFMRPENIRDFESALRDACGFSVREAKRIASAGWPALLRRDDASDELNQIAALLSKAAQDFQTR